MQIFNKTVQALTQFSGNSGSELTNINEKACNNIPQAVNKLYQRVWAILLRLGEINMITLILFNNKIKLLSQDEILALLSTSL